MIETGMNRIECDYEDIEMATNYKILSHGLASTYRIIAIKLVNDKSGISVVFIMDTPMIRWHEVEVRAAFVSPCMIVAECASIGKHALTCNSDALDLLEFRLRPVAISIIQNELIHGDLL